MQPGDIKEIFSEHKQRIALVAGAVLLLVIVTLILSLSHSSPKPKQALKKAESTGELIERVDQVMQSLSQKSQAQVSGLRFIKAGLANQNAPNGISLKGIAWSAQRPLALINDQILGVGDQIEDLRVTEITEESLTLSNEQGREWVIYPYVYEQK